MQLGGVLSTSQVANSFMGTGLKLPDAPPMKLPMWLTLPGVVKPVPLPNIAEDEGGNPPAPEAGPPEALPPLPPAEAEGRNPLTALAIALMLS